jgi:hypothetical protein
MGAMTPMGKPANEASLDLALDGHYEADTGDPHLAAVRNLPNIGA